MITDTKKNLREFYKEAQKRLFDSIVLMDKPEEHYEEKLRKITESVLNFALGDYEIGPVLVDPNSITCSMRVASMNGIIMFRDNEVTAHT